MTIGSDYRHSVFSIVKPSPAMSRVELIDGATAVTRWSGKLVLSGDYVVIVLTQDGQDASHLKLAATLRWDCVLSPRSVDRCKHRDAGLEGAGMRHASTSPGRGP